MYGCVARHLLQLDRQQEQGGAQRAVHGEGHHVGRGELCRRKQPQVEHGHARTSFPDTEGSQQHDAGAQ
jgi:hypothetical protein